MGDQMSTLNLFFSGALFAGFWVIALFFLKFWRSTGDQLFGLFTLAFFLLGIERIVMFLTSSNEFRPYIFIIRLVAFCLIIFGFIAKNRGGKSN